MPNKKKWHACLWYKSQTSRSNVCFLQNTNKTTRTLYLNSSSKHNTFDDRSRVFSVVAPVRRSCFSEIQHTRGGRFGAPTGGPKNHCQTAAQMAQTINTRQSYIVWYVACVSQHRLVYCNYTCFVYLEECASFCWSNALRCRILIVPAAWLDGRHSLWNSISNIASARWLVID